MTSDINTMSRKELEKLKIEVEKALETVAYRERKAAIEAAEKAAAAHGFTLAELSGDLDAKGRKNARGKPKSPAKYRNPENGDQTWSGRGRKPGWIVEAETAGTDIDAFAI
jgi:DNA-binding protein H-NS